MNNGKYQRKDHRAIATSTDELRPTKLFLGLMDFFCILLPGALLTYLLMGETGLLVLGDRYAKLDGSQA